MLERNDFRLATFGTCGLGDEIERPTAGLSRTIWRKTFLVEATVLDAQDGSLADTVSVNITP